MKIVFFVILQVVIGANRLSTILKSFRCWVNMFGNHSTVSRFKYLLTWVSWSFMRVICLEIDENHRCDQLQDINFRHKDEVNNEQCHQFSDYHSYHQGILEFILTVFLNTFIKNVMLVLRGAVHTQVTTLNVNLTLCF